MKIFIVLLISVILLTQPVSAAQENVETVVQDGENMIEISGKTSTGNQNVLIQILKPGIEEAAALEDIVFQKQITADEKGDFSVKFNALTDWDSGIYPVEFYYEDGTEEALKLEYKSNKDIGKDFKLLQEATDAISVRKILEQYGTEWDFDFSLYSALKEEAKSRIAECFIALGGKNATNISEASQIFDSAVIAIATTEYEGDFCDLVVGTHGAYTGFSETSAYKEFFEITDMRRVGEALKIHRVESSEEAKNRFEIEICLSVIANAKGWYDVNRAIEILCPILSLDKTAYSEAPEAIGMELSGKTFTLERFLAEFQRQIQKNTGKKVIFTDVAEQTDWASNSVNFLYEAGIVNGVSENLFEPNGNVTREQFAKMIVAMFGETEMNSANSFSDVNSKEWYSPYVATAKEIGIVNGVSETEFGVGQNITREQMATMIYRAGLLIGYQTKGVPKVFTDSNEISDYAKEAIDALTAGGVINGMSDGSFAPTATATRAEAACMIYNMMRSTGYNVNVKSGYMPISGTDPFVKYKQDFNSLDEKVYKETDKYTFIGWYFVPGGFTYLTASPAPAGKDEYKMPSDKKDMAIAIRAEKSAKAGHFDTKPFPLSDETAGKMRMEMNLYVENDNLSPNYKVFDSKFYSWVHMRGEHSMPLFYLAGDGGLYYYDESGLGIRCGDYEQKQWIHVAIDFDAEKKVYTLFLNDVIVAKDIPYNNKDIKWDGTDKEPGLRKVRVRMSVSPDSTGNSVTYIDDFVLAKYTDAPLALPVKPQSSDNNIGIVVDDNVKYSSLSQITVSVNGVQVTNAGNAENGLYTVSLPSTLKQGDTVTVTVGKWLENQNGLLTGTPKVFNYTVQ